MKNVITISLTLCYLILSSVLFAQTYTCTIQNQVAAGTDFSFDIYMQRTDATEIYLGQSEFSLTFNDVNFTAPVEGYVAGANMSFYTMSVDIPAGFENVVKLSVGALFFNNQSEFDARVCKPSTSAPGTHIATVTISGITNSSGFSDLQWRTTSPHDSKINNYLNVDPWTLTNITGNGTYTDPVSAPLPVELVSFTGQANEYSIELNWKTATEVNNYGFDVERKITNSDWSKIGFVEGHGNSNSPKQYSFTDKKPIGGSKFVYRLKQIDNDGSYKYSEQVEVEIIPGEFELYQNYPNPFNPNTKIRYQLPQESKVIIKIYDILGSEVITLLNEKKEPGVYEVDFGAQSAVGGLPSGTYFYRIVADGFIETKKMILLK